MAKKKKIADCKTDEQRADYLFKNDVFETGRQPQRYGLSDPGTDVAAGASGTRRELAHS